MEGEKELLHQKITQVSFLNVVQPQAGIQQPYKGVKHWHALQRGRTLKTRPQDQILRDPVHTQCLEQADPERAGVWFSSWRRGMGTDY